MTQDTKVHPASAKPAEKKPGRWKKCLGMAGVLIGFLFVAGLVGYSYYVSLTDTRIKDIGKCCHVLKSPKTAKMRSHFKSGLGNPLYYLSNPVFCRCY